jgi:translation initiation factor RLI1
LSCTIKPQYVDHIPKAVSGTVEEVVSMKADRGNMDELLTTLELNHVRDRQASQIKWGWRLPARRHVSVRAAAGCCSELLNRVTQPVTS